MVNHTTLKHSIKSQYKCGYCHVRSSVRTAFDTHFAAKHPDKAFRVLCMYYRLDSNDIEPLPPGGGASSSSHEPLWRRNDPDRRRQIRGILLEDENEEKSGFLDVLPGAPKGEEFVCPKCHSFMTPCRNTFRSHLCKEANYQRFECAECGVTNPLLPTLRRHYTKTHGGSSFTPDCYITLPVESTLEAMVESIISQQQHMIRKWKESGAASLSSSSPSPSKGGGGGGRRASSSPSSSTVVIQGEGEEGSSAVLHDSGSDKGKFVCHVCGVECRTGSGLKSHITAMHQTKFKCQLCPFSSNTELAIQNHRSLKHPKHDLLPHEGSKSTSRGGTASAETEVPADAEGEPTGKRGPADATKKTFRHECTHCSYRTNNNRAFYTHTQKHVRFRSYLCEYCGKRFESVRDGNRHSYWKHPNKDVKILHAPAAAEEGEDVEADLVEKGEDDVGGLTPSSVSEEKGGPSTESRKGGSEPPARPPPAGVADEARKPALMVCYSCCHCSLKGPYAFTEEHLKAQHRDLPFLIRKEEGATLHLEVYRYKCGHCPVDSVSLMEAMDHWVKNHVTLDFKFSLNLFSSSLIKSDNGSGSGSQVVPKDSGSGSGSGSSTPGPTLPDTKPATKTGTPTTPASLPSPPCSSTPTKKGAGGALASTKPDSSSIQSDDLADPTEDELDDSFSDFVDGATDNSDVESNQVTSSTSDKDAMYKCGYCRKIGKKKSDIYDHIRKIHKEKPIKLNIYQKREYDRMYRGVFECGYCGKQGSTADMSKHTSVVHPGSVANLKRILRAKQKEKTCFRCEICSHVVKARKSIKGHMERLHPDSLTAFTKIQFESTFKAPTKQPIKCNYCGDTAVTTEEMETHHNFLHSHLPPSFINLRDEALLSIHKGSSGGGSGGSQTGKEEVGVGHPPSSGLGDLSPLVPPSVEPTASPSLGGSFPFFNKNKARKSFPITLLQAGGRRSQGGQRTQRKRQIATKSTSGRLQLVRVGVPPKEESDEEEEEEEVEEEEEEEEEEEDEMDGGGTGFSSPRSSSSSPVKRREEVGFSSYGQNSPPNFNRNEIYAVVNLLGGVPTRLSVTQLSALVNLNPKVRLKDVGILGGAPPGFPPAST